VEAPPGREREMSMRIGDLVKFRKEVAGMEALTGIVVEINGDLLRVMWSNKTLGIELPDMLELINESR
jgi:hypothetical protein